jgi:hypothetical protein
MKDKEIFIYFLCGLPRAGNTLLGSLLNQSKNVKVTANTILTDVIYQIELLKNYEIYNNFPDEESLNNILKNIFNNYYQDWNVDNIIDRGPWGTPINLKLLKKIIKKPKFIVLYRPVLECLASFIKIEKPTNVEKRCHQLMKDDGMIGKNLWSIKNIIKEKEDYILIHYKDFIKNPNENIKKMFNYLNIEFKNLKFNNFKKFSVNNISYNDSIYKVKLHDIRTDKIKLNKYKIEDYLPSNIINEYSNLDI